MFGVQKKLEKQAAIKLLVKQEVEAAMVRHKETLEIEEYRQKILRRLEDRRKAVLKARPSWEILTSLYKTNLQENFCENHVGVGE